MTIVFWQNCPSIHQTPLLNALVEAGVDVYQFYQEAISSERLAMGWKIEGLKFQSKLIQDISEIDRKKIQNGCIHIFSGFRSFRAVREQLDYYYRLCPDRIFVFAERPDTRGGAGLIRKFLYQWHVYRYKRIAGILAAGSVGYFTALPFKIRLFPFMYYTCPNNMQPSNHARRQHPYTFLYVGSLIPLKNVEIILNAMRIIQESDACASFRCLIIGSGLCMKDLKILVNQYALSDKVEFLGHMSNQDVIQYYEIADSFILPSWKDGYGAVVNEALLAGCRVACSANAGASETLSQLGMLNRVFDPRSTSSLVRILQEDLQKGKVSDIEREGRIRNSVSLRPEYGASLLLGYVKNLE